MLARLSDFLACRTYASQYRQYRAHNKKYMVENWQYMVEYRQYMVEYRQYMVEYRQYMVEYRQYTWSSIGNIHGRGLAIHGRVSAIHGRVSTFPGQVVVKTRWEIKGLRSRYSDLTTAPCPSLLCEYDISWIMGLRCFSGSATAIFFSAAAFGDSWLPPAALAPE